MERFVDVKRDKPVIDRVYTKPLTDKLLVAMHAQISDTKETILQGVITTDELKRIETECIDAVQFVPSPTLVKDQFVENIAKFGWPGDTDSSTSWSYDTWASCISDKCYEDNGKPGYQWVFIDNYRQLLKDVHNNWLPCALRFHYIAANMDNWNYDLERVVEILRKNPSVVFLDEGNFDCPAEKGKEILDIPYYNATEDCSSYVYFIWRPTAQEFQQLMVGCGDNYTNRYSVIFEMDMLGLRRGGAAKSDKFYRRK